VAGAFMLTNSKFKVESAPLWFMLEATRYMDISLAFWTIEMKILGTKI
jgi:hypothetical protein